ncbi:hypothetical protein GF324_04720 [bacterium]|nr:hypothetical protein [bacterium]
MQRKDGPVSTQPVTPVFVIGYPNSGTTLLQKMLGRHTLMHPTVSETYFFEFPYLYEERYPSLDTADRFAGFARFCANLLTHGFWDLYVHHTATEDPAILSDVEIHRLRADLPRVPSHAQVFGAVGDRLAHRDGKAYWLEKSPAHAYHAVSILSALPAAKCIEIVRDPRDIMASKKLRRGVHVKGLRSGGLSDHDRRHLGMTEYDPLWVSLAWKRTVAAVDSAHEAFPGRVLSVRYEDLVERPQETVERLCESLGLPFEPPMLEVPRSNVADRGKLWQDEGAGVVTSSLHRWRKTLSDAEVLLAQRFLRGEMKRYGYVLHRAGVLPRYTGLLLIGCSFANLLTRLYRKTRHQGWAHTRRMIALYARRGIELATGK